MRRDSLLDLLRDFSALPDDFLVYDDGYRSWNRSYAEVGRAARALAQRLHEAGVRRGDRVLVWGENRPEWVVSLWGCLYAGAVVVPLDYRTSADFLLRVREIVHAPVLLVGEEVSLPHPPPGLQVWPMSGFAWPDVEPVLSQPPTAQKDDLAEILFTSGATAEPKGVLITHRNLLANIVPVEGEILKYRRYARPFAPVRFLNLLPLSHLFGQTMASFIPPVLPGVVTFLKSYHPQEVVRQIHSRRISVLVCVPKILEVLRDYVIHAVPEAGGEGDPLQGRHFLWRWWHYRRVHRLLGWKFWAFVVGAAPLPPELEEFWRKLGYVVIQGYGLTETAPVVTLNHPFHTRKGSVGKPIAGVEVRIADDGEVLVRGDNVTKGYLNGSNEAFRDGWFHTGDIGELDSEGRLSIRGRKKEMIVTPEGLNVFPEDVERVLVALPGVRDAAAVGSGEAGQERVAAVLLLEPGTDPDALINQANRQLEDHQAVRKYALWPDPELPRTDGTRKLRRRELRAWLAGETQADGHHAGTDALLALLAERVPGRDLREDTTLESLGLSSLERVQLLMALEERLGATVDETAFTQSHTIADLRRLVSSPSLPAAPGSVEEAFPFPHWARQPWAWWHRRFHLPLWILPLTRLFAWIRVEGRDHLTAVRGPVIFAANHTSYLDSPVIYAALPARFRYHLATAMSKEFFDAHFHPERHPWSSRLTNSLNYVLSALSFHAFPLPQRSAGLRQALRFAGELAADGTSILIFPEGAHTRTGEVGPFLPGVAMLATRLKLPVVPVRLEGVNGVLHPTWRMARPGRVTVRFGPPVLLEGDDYARLAEQVGSAVRQL